MVVFRCRQSSYFSHKKRSKNVGTRRSSERTSIPIEDFIKEWQKEDSTEESLSTLFGVGVQTIITKAEQLRERGIPLREKRKKQGKTKITSEEDVAYFKRLAEEALSNGKPEISSLGKKKKKKKKGKKHRKEEEE
jgi:hypothetical protein